MKKNLLFFGVVAILIMVFSFTAAAERFVSDEAGLEMKDSDTLEFKNSVIRPTDNINWSSDLELSLSYPEAALKQELEGGVLILCTVDTDGNVSDVKILQDIGGGAGLEVAGAVRKLKFNPAMQNGYATSYTMIIPVVFDLEK